MRAIVLLQGLGMVLLAAQAHTQRIRVGQLTEKVAVVGDTGAEHDQDVDYGGKITEQAVGENAPPEHDGGITISEDPTSADEPPVPISAILFSGEPGPKKCRGRPVLKVDLSKPGSQHATPRCYNVSGGIAQCGNLVANKDDGCEARLFNEPDCLTFVNVGVFTPEPRALGGYMRSIEIRCGVKSTTPPPPSLPGLKLPSGAQLGVGKVSLLSTLPAYGSHFGPALGHFSGVAISSLIRATLTRSSESS